MSYIYAGSQSVGEVRNQQLSHSLMTGLQMDEHIARIALNQGATPQVKTYLTDALGSVIATAKADQSLEVGYAFSPYGQTQKVGVENQLAGSENSSQYTGRENDNNGLYFYRARYYDPVLKRFISEDPIGLRGGDNVFMYVEGNPIMLVDALGEQAKDPTEDPDLDKPCAVQCDDVAQCLQCCHAQSRKLAAKGTPPGAIGSLFLSCRATCSAQMEPKKPAPAPLFCSLIPKFCSTPKLPGR